MRGSRGAQACLIVSALALLFVANNTARLRGAAPEDLFRTWRAFDDFAIGAGYASRDVLPVAPYRVRDVIRREKDPRFRDFKERLLTEIAAKSIEPTSFWRTFPAGEVSPDGRWLIAKRFDDSGRALLLGIGFRLLGGAAPYLLFWLAILAAIPILVWVHLELAAVGQGLAGLAFLIAVSLSGFVLDVLALGYSAVGFHMVALLAVVPLAVYAVFGVVTMRGLLGRAAACGIVIAVCSVCRGTTPFLLPGYAAALTISVTRQAALDRKRRLAAWAAGLALMVVPYVGLRTWTLHRIEAARDDYGREPMPQYHDASLLLWKGLGDFDRTKGYAFRDKAGEEAILRVDPEKRAHRDAEVLLRQLIVDDVRADPLWLAAIVVKRLLATVSLYKLWPWTPWDGMAIYPATTPNEGAIDLYYGLTRHADWLAFGKWNAELPVWLLLLPMLGLAALAFGAGSRPRLAAALPIARRSWLVLGCVALAVLPTPVVITTATALETECFVVVHLLALAFLVQSLYLLGGRTR
jgi:hypothetical protein